MRAAAAILAAVAALAAPAFAAGQPDELVDRGAELYARNCVGCHGPGGEGVTSSPAPGQLGPSLVGVGALAADFYLRSGYMPLRDPYAQPERGEPAFSDEQIEALVAYVASLGDGPAVPEPDPGGGSLSEGLELFTENCAGCHQVVAEGGMVTGAVAPPLAGLPAVQIAEAVRIGPYVMPSFSEEDLSDAQVDSIVRYVHYAEDPQDEGGWGIGHIGPVPEGLVAWIVAGVALVGVSLALGGRIPR